MNNRQDSKEKKSNLPQGHLITQPKSPKINCIQRLIISLSDGAWKLGGLLILIIFLFGVITLVAYYMYIYGPFNNERSFIYRINCTIANIKTNTRFCTFSQELKSCQLLTGRCSSNDTEENHTLYWTWSDYETSAANCTNDPCSQGRSISFQDNSTLAPVYSSHEYSRAYLNRTTTIAASTATSVFCFLMGFVIVTFILIFVFIYILCNYEKYHELLHPSLGPISQINPLQSRRAAAGNAIVPSVYLSPATRRNSSTNQRVFSLKFHSEMPTRELNDRSPTQIRFFQGLRYKNSSERLGASPPPMPHNVILVQNSTL